MTYLFKFRRRFFFTQSFLVIGHQYNQATDKMVLFFPDESIREITNWKHCSMMLGVDHAEAQKKHLADQQAKQSPVAKVSPIKG